MKNIIFVTPECFIDVDIPILNILKDDYNIIWFIIFNKDSKSILDKSVIKKFANEFNIEFVLKMRPAKLKSINNLFFDLELLREISKIKTQIIYIESFIDLYFAAFSRFYLSRAKTIIAIHDVIPHINNLTFLKRISNKVLRRTFRYFQLFSKSQSNEFLIQYPDKSIFTIPLMPKFVAGSENCKNILTHNASIKTIFLLFGFLRYNKGVDFLIQAGELLVKKGYRNFIIKIVGDCENWAAYDKLIQNREIFDLRIEMIPNKEIHSYLQNCHFLVLPYRDVTQSGPLSFAFTYEIPSIVSDLEGFRELIVDNQNGLMFESENIVLLAKAMEKALNMSNLDYQEMKKHIADYREKNLSEESIINLYKKMFNSINKDDHS